jgi:hypothetical protein
MRRVMLALVSREPVFTEDNGADDAANQVCKDECLACRCVCSLSA